VLNRLHLLLAVSFELSLRHDFDVWTVGSVPRGFSGTGCVVVWLAIVGLCLHPQFLQKTNIETRNLLTLLKILTIFGGGWFRFGGMIPAGCPCM
jgi:hypothetical protein